MKSYDPFDNDFAGAARDGDLATVQTKLADGTDPNTPNEMGGLPIWFAAQNGHIEVVRALIAGGASPNPCDSSGALITASARSSALIAAATDNQHEILGLLLDADADPNLYDKNGQTALHWALTHGSDETVAILLEAGPDLNMLDRYGNSSLSIAEDRERYEIAALLRDRGALRSVGEPKAIVESDKEALSPPDWARVLQRAWVLCAMAYRAFLESCDDDSQSRHEELREWLDYVKLWDEFEDSERAFVVAPLGTPAQQDIVDATWRSEGLVVLAWALGMCELPPHDDMADAAEIAHCIDFLSDDPDLRRIKPRSFEALEAFASRQLGLHWRLREFGANPVAIDLVALAKDCWFGGMNTEGVTILQRDLAIAGIPIAEAHTDDIGRCYSIAFERHQAINWLHGWDSVYSEVDTNT